MTKLEEKKRFEDIIQRAIAAQKESLATDGYLLSSAELAAKIGEAAHRSFIGRHLPKALKAPYAEGQSPRLAKQAREDEAKMEAIQREATANGGAPLSIPEVAEKMPHRTLHWLRVHYTKLPQKLRRPAPTTFLDYAHGPPLPEALQVAAAEVSKALNQGTSESKVEQRSVAEAVAKKNTNDLMLSLIHKAVQEGKLSCPHHPEAKLVWSCGDPLNGNVNEQTPRAPDRSLELGLTESQERLRSASWWDKRAAWQEPSMLAPKEES